MIAVVRIKKLGNFNNMKDINLFPVIVATIMNIARGNAAIKPANNNFSITFILFILKYTKNFDIFKITILFYYHSI